MFTKVLVATDLSGASEQVIGAIGDLKQIGTREAVLIHSFNIRDVGSLANRLMELAQPSFERQKKKLQEHGLTVSGKMVLGLPQIEINRQADEHDCSLIVVGATGQTMAGEILLGGVTSAVIHSATRPVLVLRMRLKNEKGEPVGEEASCRPLEHILFPTDFSDNAEHAFTYVQRLADCGAKRVTLLHVQDEGRIGKHLKDRLEEFNRIDTGRLNRLKDDLTQRGVGRVDIELLYGSPKKEVIARTKKDGISLVVMGSQGRGFLGDMFLGSVSHAATRKTEVPILLIPAIR